MMLRACRFSVSCALTALLLGSIGCATSQQTRAQKPDEPPDDDRYEMKVIADATDAVTNADVCPVAGVGLVTGLNGTGSVTRPSGWRSRLERELQRLHVNNIKEILDDKDNSLVLVTGMIPPGGHKGDTIDIDVTVPPGSETTSLRGGTLQECLLIDYDLIAALGPSSSTDRMGQGLVRAKASGRLLVDLGEDNEHAATKARIWGGGKSLLERTFSLSMNHENQSARIVAQVTERINESFHGPARGFGSGNVAAPGSDHVSVVITVPQQYRHNLPRYLRVVRMIPLRQRRKNEKDDPAAKPVSPDELMANYHRQLETDLLDPAHTVTAALRLEALGVCSTGSLKRGLNSEHALVRFCAAEALAYLGCASGAVELSHIVAEQPYLRAYALTALASLVEEGPCRSLLQELLSHPEAEVRYGAFRALRTLDENDNAIQGEFLNRSFWLHRVAEESTPMIHISTSRRAEIVLFGKETELVPGFSILSGNFVLSSANQDSHCTISHRVGTERRYRQCSLKVEEVIRTMSGMGAQYNEVLEFLSHAYRIKSLNCELCFDALPQAPTVQELAKAGKDVRRRADLARAGKNPEAQDRTDEELLNATSQFSGTPGLFERPAFARQFSFAERGADPVVDEPRSGRQ
jgi:hypothetical protein